MNNDKYITIIIYLALQNEIQDFKNHVEEVIIDGLTNVKNIYTTVTLLNTCPTFSPENYEKILLLLLKVVQKLAQDVSTPTNPLHYNAPHQNQNQPPSQTPQPNYTPLLISLLKFLKERIQDLPTNDQRKPFLNVLQYLIEQSKDVFFFSVKMNISTILI